MSKFEIAGILIELETDNPQVINRLKDFISNSDKVPDLKVSIWGSNKINKPEGKIIMDEGIKWLQEYSSKNTCVFKYRSDSDEVSSILKVDDNWNNASINYIKHDVESEFTATESLCEILFRNTILFHQGIVIHASAITCEGRGIAFSAPSGTGKSTQAELWERFKNGEIINDDRPVIRVLEKGTYIYGTPWSGSSSIYLNRCEQLSIIVALEQSKENTIQRLTSGEALTRLMPRCFLPYHERGLMIRALNNFERVIAKTPVYLLKCKPDMEAVELVAKCLK